MNIEKINPAEFTYEKWRNGPLTQLGIENRFYSIKDNIHLVRKYAVGYCDAGQLDLRPKPEQFAVMFFKKGIGYFWTHLIQEEFELCFGKQDDN